MTATLPPGPGALTLRLSRRDLAKLAAALGAVQLTSACTTPPPVAGQAATQEKTMMLATTTVENVEHWLKVFATTSLAKRKHFGSKGATVYLDPNQADRVWVIFDWDVEGFRKFGADPEVQAILKEAGHKGRPQVAALSSRYTA